MRGYRSEDKPERKQFKAGPPVRVDGAKATRATEKALLVRIRNREHWVPQSAIHADSEVWRYGDEGVLIVAHWWASRNGFS